MIETQQVKMSEMKNDPKMIEMLKVMLVDGNTVENALDYLEDWVSPHKLLVSGSVIGYFTLQHSQNPGFVEAHAFIYPECRKYSTRSLRTIVEYSHNLGYKVQTSVLGNFPHVLRVLKAIGFSVIGVEDNAFTKEGVSYPIFHLSK